jgi:hypothetical protein
METPTQSADVAAIATEVTNQIIVYTPTAVATVQAAVQIAETTGTSGKDKFAAVMKAVQDVSGVAAGIPVPSVSAIAMLINLTVSIFNATGFFAHK